MNAARLDRLHRALIRLLEELGPIWPQQDVDYVGDEVRHGEYGDALENLVAIGLRNGSGFNPSHLRQIETLAAAMGMQDPPLLTRLREAAHG